MQTVKKELLEAHNIIGKHGDAQEIDAQLDLVKEVIEENGRFKGANAVLRAKNAEKDEELLGKEVSLSRRLSRDIGATIPCAEERTQCPGPVIKAV